MQASWTISFFILSFGLSVSARECPRLEEGVRISAVGDVLVHEALYRELSGGRDRFRALWTDLIPLLRDADLSVANLEGPTAPGVLASGRTVPDPGFVYDGEVYSGTNFVFNYHPSLLADLKKSGFGLVTTANNHALDRASVGVDRTIQQLESAGLPFVGTRTRDHSVDGFERIVSVKSFRLGVIACTEMVNGNPDPGAQVRRCEDAKIVDSIARLRANTDAVIVFPHWGEEYQLAPSARQKAWARRWVGAGATAVIGNHPHVLQTVERIARDDGSTAIAIYSLGNFVAAQGAMEKRASAIAHLDLVPTPSGLELAQFSYTPIVRPRGSLTLRLLGSKPSAELQHVERQLGEASCR